LFDTRWYYIPEDNHKNSKNIDGESVFIESAKKAVDFLFSNYLESFDDSKTELKEKLIDYFSKLPEDFDYDLEKDIKLFSLPFRNIERIIDRKEFRDKTEEIMEEVKKGNYLYILSPSAAEWFKEWAEAWKDWENVNKRIKILINEDVWTIQDSIHFRHIKKITEGINQFLATQRVKLTPNVKYGITLAFDQIDQNIRNGKALIFYREGKASAFTPMYIEEKNIKDQKNSDICKLKVYFEQLFSLTRRCT